MTVRGELFATDIGEQGNEVQIGTPEFLFRVNIATIGTLYDVANLDDAQIALLSNNGSIAPEMAQALQKIAAQKGAVRKLEQDMEDRQKDIDRIVADQARLRENMKALKGSSEEKALVQRYTSELDHQETQLDSLRKTIQSTEAQRDKANDELENMIDSVQLQATL